MCGLVGIAGDTTSNWKDVFTDLLVVDSLRGAHSTGMAVIKRFQNEITLVKQPGGPHSLLSNPDYRANINHAVKALIGHNRYATLGEHTVENSHPFAFENVVGAHNGTLDKSAIKLLHCNELFDTDSEAIYCNINQHGLRDTVDKLRGAWALTWYDVKTNSINMLRNDKRPLWYCYSKDRCTMLWASEPDMLEFILKRARNPIFEDNIFSVDPDQHYQWVIPDSISKKFEAPKKEEMKALPPPPVAVHYYNGGGYNWKPHNHGGNEGNVLPFPAPEAKFPTGGKKNTGNIPTTVFERQRRNTKNFRPPYKDATGKTMNKKEFNKLTADGCVFCQNNDIDWGDYIHPLRAVDGHHTFLCEDCYNDDDIFETCSSLI